MSQPNAPPMYNKSSELMSTAHFFFVRNVGLEKTDVPAEVFEHVTNGAEVPPAPLTRIPEAEGRA